MLTLAQTVLDPKLWFFIGLLFLFIFVGAITIFAIRRSFLSDEVTTNPAGGGLLEHLDEMHKTGKITKEEYDATRASIIEKASQQMRQEAQQADTPPNHSK
jgi:uncharacterized membrane protein